MYVCFVFLSDEEITDVQCHSSVAFKDKPNKRFILYKSRQSPSRTHTTHNPYFSLTRHHQSVQGGSGANRPQQQQPGGPDVTPGARAHTAHSWSSSLRQRHELIITQQQAREEEHYRGDAEEDGGTWRERGAGMAHIERVVMPVPSAHSLHLHHGCAWTCFYLTTER